MDLGPIRVALTVLVIYLLWQVAVLHEEMHEVQELLGITHG